MKVMHRERKFLVECKSIDREKGTVRIIHPCTGREIDAPMALYDLTVDSLEKIDAMRKEERRRLVVAASRNGERFWNLLLGEPGRDYVWKFGRLFPMNGNREDFVRMCKEWSAEKNQYMKLKIREEIVARFRSYDAETVRERFEEMLNAARDKSKVMEAATRCSVASGIDMGFGLAERREEDRQGAPGSGSNYSHFPKCE
ncbi:MAG: hypothetical protein JRH07_08950 [Deltaproteobacteria bacterium]|nr:hypothetical protein [Deltaproteobacteria bacterium]